MELSDNTWYTIAAIIWIISVLAILLLTFLVGGKKSTGEQFTFTDLVGVSVPPIDGATPTIFPPWLLVDVFTKNGADHFGSGMGTNGDIIAVGAPEEGSTGRVYTYKTENDTIVAQANFASVDGNLGARVSVRRQGDNIIASLPSTNAGGSVLSFIYQSDAWEVSQNIVLNEGISTSALGKKALVFSSSGNRFFANITGSLVNPEQGNCIWYVGEVGDWKSGTTAQLKPPEATIEYATAIASNAAGDVIIVGDPGHNKSTGITYEFQDLFGSWTFIGQLFGNNLKLRFGEAVAISESGLTLAVGAPGENDNNGLVYIYTRNNVMSNWFPDGKLKHFDIGVRFGSALSMTRDGLWLAVGESGESGGTHIHLFNAQTGVFRHESSIDTSLSVPPTETLTDQIHLLFKSTEIEPSLFCSTAGPSSGSILWYRRAGPLVP